MFTLNNVYVALESTPRLTRGGLAAGLVAGGGALVGSAPVVRPTVRPERVDLMFPVVGWWIAVGVLVWLTFSLGAWIVVLGRPGLEDSRVVRLLVAPGSRRLAEGLLTVGVLAACSPSPSQVAAPQIEVLRPADPGAPTTAVPTSFAEPSTAVTVAAVPTSTTQFSEGPVSDGSDSVEPLVQDPPIPSATSHTVLRGDNIWTIAAQHLSIRLGRPASNTEVSHYWVAVIEANTASIRSGDPNLIYPGEVLLMPPIQ